MGVDPQESVTTVDFPASEGCFCGLATGMPHATWEGCARALKVTYEDWRARAEKDRDFLDDLMDWRCGIPGHAVAVGCGVSYHVQRYLGFDGPDGPIRAGQYMKGKLDGR